MSEEKQIEEMAKDLCDARICRLADWESCPDKDGSCTRCRLAARTMIAKNYHKQSEGEWISVDERLPKHLEKVVAIDTWGDMFTAVYIMFVNEKSTWSTPYSHGGKVTHWMPLPEAPKMKGGE